MTAELQLPRDQGALATPLIEARNVRLHVPLVKTGERNLLASPGRLIRDLYLSRSTRVNATLLDGNSFSLTPSERLGPIGSNGAGTSTLLRVLAGIYLPSSGTLKVDGTAKDLFDISLGMRAEATGLENIYLRGLQMGLGLKQIRALVPAVMALSELGDDIEKQLNTSLSGMRLRLAISISIMVEPDILLLDEWIGAGDATFNEKVKDRMMSLVENSRGLVLATHNVSLMKSLCTHGMVLDKGRMTFLGPVDDALKFYAEQTAGGAAKLPNLSTGPANAQA